MDIFAFMSGSPWLTWFLAIIVSSLIFKIINRMLRTINIYKHGYPPAHCDADGDFKDCEEY